jgi:class 3 adenylate cyclase
MARQTAQLSILFADITKSSAIYEHLGDTAAQVVVGRILDLLSELTVNYGGKVVKTVGDAVISTFPAAHNAIGAAKSMQLAMTEDISGHKDLPAINIHIGIHHGPVVIDNEDIFGDAVNITARVVDYANPRQIIATRSAVNNLPENSGHFTRYITKITAKNISGELELFEVIYEDQNTTMVIDCRQVSRAMSASLHLKRGDESIVIDLQKPLISIGREDFNDIVIRYSWISRTHAYIENRNGVFLLRDKSTNGTFLYPGDAAPVYVNKGEHPIAGKGEIVFGREKENRMEAALNDTIEYEIR